MRLFFFREIKFTSPLHGMAIGGNQNILETFDGGITWDYSYCRPNTAFYDGYTDFEWPAEDYPLLVESQISVVNLLRLTDTPVFENCEPTFMVENPVPSFQSSVFPNPANGQITLNFSLTKEMKVAITLNDLYGRQVQTLAKSNFYGQGENEITANLDGLPNGMYLIHFQSDSGVNSIKFIKQ